MLLTTFPKCGTNLMTQYLNRPVHIRVSEESWLTDEQVGYDEGTMCQLRDFAKNGFGHIPAKPHFVEAANHHPTEIIFLIRDPRDQIASMFHWTRRQNGSMASLVRGDPDPIMAIINLVPDLWKRFLPWMEQDNVTTIAYEDLIDSEDRELERIEAVVGKTEALFWIGGARNMKRRKRPSESPTFRKGESGDWANLFEPRHLDAFERSCSGVMEVLGYDL